MLEKEVLKDLTYHHEQSNIRSSYYVYFFLQSTASHINCLIELWYAAALDHAESKTL